MHALRNAKDRQNGRTSKGVPILMRRQNLSIAAVLLAVAVAAPAEQKGIHLPSQRTARFTWSTQDAKGYRWDITGNGAVSDGTKDAYDGGVILQVNGSNFNTFSTGRLSKDGSEVEIGPWNRNNLRIYRRIFVHKKKGYCRWIDIFENPTGSAISVSLRYYSNMGASTRRTHTSSGGTSLKGKDWGIVTDGSNSLRPAIVHVFATPNAKQRPSFQHNNSDSLYYNMTLKVPAKKAVALCLFEAQRRPYKEAVKFLKDFSPRRELGMVSPALRRIILNMAGASLSLGGIELDRRESADLLVTRDGDEMLGTIVNESFSLKTEFGEEPVEIDPGELFGIVGRSRHDDRVHLILDGGQIVAGRLTSGPIKFRLAGGTELPIPVRKLKQAAYRVSADKPIEIKTNCSLVILRSGPRLGFEEGELSLSFVTPHGKLKLRPEDLRFIEMDTPDGGLHRAVFRNGSVLAGLLTAERLDMNLRIEQRLDLPRQRVSRLFFANPPIEAGGLAEVRLRNGDHLLGRPADAKWVVKSKFGDVDVAAKDIKSVEFSEEALGQVDLVLRDGTKLGGRLSGDYVRFQVKPGPELKIFVGRLQSVDGGDPPAEPAEEPQPESVEVEVTATDDRTIRGAWVLDALVVVRGDRRHEFEPAEIAAVSFVKRDGEPAITVKKVEGGPLEGRHDLKVIELRNASGKTVKLPPGKVKSIQVVRPGEANAERPPPKKAKEPRTPA
jgi:hypothetical protein